MARPPTKHPLANTHVAREVRGVLEAKKQPIQRQQPSLKGKEKVRWVLDAELMERAGEVDGAASDSSKAPALKPHGVFCKFSRFVTRNPDTFHCQ